MNLVETGHGMCPAERELKADMPPRVNVSVAVKQIKRTFVYPHVKDPFPFVDLDGDYVEEDAISLYNDSKGERFALAAIWNAAIIDFAWDHRSEFPPYGLLDKVTIVDRDNGQETVAPLERIAQDLPYHHLSSAMLTTLDAYRSVLLARIKEGGKVPKYVAKSVARLREWQDFCDGNLPKAEYPQAGYVLVENPSLSFMYPMRDEAFVGAGSGIDLMVSVIKASSEKLVDEFGEDNVSEQLVRSTALNSFSLVAEIANLDDHTGAGVEIVLLKYYEAAAALSFDPDDVNLERKHDGYRLNLAYATWESARDVLSLHPNRSGETLTAGCPVMAKVDGESRMRKLYEWLVDLGVEIYKDQDRREK